MPMVRITRDFDAPVDKVFRAHADPDLFVKWNGPNSLTSTIEQFDFRTGGAYRYTMRRDGFEAGFHGPFHDIRTNELIVQTFTFDGMPDSVALEKLRFEDIGNDRTRLTGTSLVDSFADRDALSPAAWKPASKKATNASTPSSPPTERNTNHDHYREFLHLSRRLHRRPERPRRPAVRLVPER